MFGCAVRLVPMALSPPVTGSTSLTICTKEVFGSRPMATLSPRLVAVTSMQLSLKFRPQISQAYHLLWSRAGQLGWTRSSSKTVVSIRMSLTSATPCSRRAWTILSKIQPAGRS